MSEYLQSNTQRGSLVKSSVGSLQGFEGLIVNLVNNGGFGSVALPTTANSRAYGVIIDGSITDTEAMQTQGPDWGPAGAFGVVVLPLASTQNMRAYLLGTCNPGDVLVLAPVAAGQTILLPLNYTSTGGQVTLTTTAGMIQSAASVGAGTFGVVGIAEDAVTSGAANLVLFRPIFGQLITQ